MDVGKSINPGIDRGQIVGGFIQGLGWVTTEQLMYGPKGDLWSCSPTTYKIPAITDLPEIFNVRFLDNPNSDKSLYRGKAVGEPPLLLAVSAWLAVKNALTHVGVSKPAASRPSRDRRACPPGPHRRAQIYSRPRYQVKKGPGVSTGADARFKFAKPSSTRDNHWWLRHDNPVWPSSYCGR